MQEINNANAGNELTAKCDSVEREVTASAGYLTKPEVAARLRKTTRTIDSWMARGILPYMKIGRSVLFDWEDCQRHLSQHFRISQLDS